ncbi:hypothetical protein ACFWZ2_14460 [Streptomyces sp. NPDC059002]|uniref:hypothetical protein n=1 Tax=Streptomyces sp. NPDC059002 TaxID=3346690 RepID=UPI0036C23F9B
MKVRTRLLTAAGSAALLATLVPASAAAAEPTTQDPSASAACVNTAHPPASPAPGIVTASGQRDGAECGNANVELRIFLDIRWQGDPQVADVSRYFATGFVDASGDCSGTGGQGAGWYSELSVNGTVVAESDRVRLAPNCGT